MGKSMDKAKPDATDKASHKIYKVADKAMDKTEKMAEKFADKMDKAKPGAEDEIFAKFDERTDKVFDKFETKVVRIVHKVDPNASEDQDAAWSLYQSGASATGENTFTQVETAGNMIDHGSVTVAKINMTATAVAEDGDNLYASADTSIESNSDISLLIKFEEGLLESNGVSYDISNVKFIGFKLPESLSSPDGPNNREIVIEREGDADWDPELEGNTATVIFDVKVLGDNTLASADAYALAIENALSESTLAIETAAD